MAVGKHPDRAEIEAGQLAQLRSLVAELFPANSFYTQKLQSAGVTFDIASLEDFSNRFPFTTKRELVEDQRRRPPYGTNLTYPLANYTRCHQTSGTSSAPLRWLDTPENWDGMIESWTQIFHVAGVERADRIYFAFSFGPFIGFWLAFEAAGRLGCLCVPGGGLSSVARLRSIIDNEATVLCCTPTYAIRLAEAATAENIDLAAAQIKTIIVAGEPGGSIPAVRNRLAGLWHGARVFDHHGMTEVGPVTYECPQRACVLHVIESAYFAEVIDPVTAKRIVPGQTGELVLTTLGRIGSPLLRYRTGDLVKPAAQTSTLNSQPCACACGRFELALEGGILGRTDDMVVVRGVNVYPGAVEEIIRAAGGVAEYQVNIGTNGALAELNIKIEPATDCRDVAGLIHRLESSFDKALALRVPVTAVSPGSLPRFEMKAKRWVRS